MLKVSVKDFGPIIEGAVDLKPLTMFVGPSNAGKSYLAMLAYSLIQSFGALSVNPFSVNPYVGQVRLDLYRFGDLGRRAFLTPIDESLAKDIDEWALNVETNYLARNNLSTLTPFSGLSSLGMAHPFGFTNPYESLDISFPTLPEEVQRLVHNSVRTSLDLMGHLFSREVQRCHGDLSSIRTRGVGTTQLRVGFEQNQPRLVLNFEEENGNLRVLPDADWDMSESKFKIGSNLLRSLRVESSIHSPRSGAEETAEPRGESRYWLLALLTGSAPATLVEGLPKNCYYLPAARSGIAQGHKAIASILVRQSPFAAIRPLEVPTLSGIITDFMGHILTMEQAGRQNGVEVIEEVVGFLETEVLRGKVDIEQVGEVTYPEIYYAPVSGQPESGKFPFHKTSSMVSELAPVILFLKYLVRPGDLVILEEPESHLHPASQRQMARGIARLVNAGVRVIITTHSDYFVGQVNNLLKLGSASKNKRAKEGYDAVDCLKSEDVSAYHFRLDEKSRGSRVQELPILPGFGIDEQEFAAVSEELYKETVSLQKIRTSR